MSGGRGWLGTRVAAFGWALRGLARLVRRDPHARIHFAATIVVVLLAAELGLPARDWLWLTLAVALVWIAEALNAAIETLADRITRERDPMIGAAKDIAAGAVLVAVLAALVIGALVLGPPLLALV